MIDDRIYKGKALLYEGIEFNEEVIFYCNDVGTSAIVLEFYKDLKTPYSLEGARVAVNIAKKDGNIVTDFMNITGENKAEYIYPINGLTAVGKSNCTILVYDGNGDRVTFGTFKFRVRADINGDVESTTEYPVLNKLISDVDVLNQDVNSAEALRIVEENHRKSNEVERKNNENDRVKTFNDIKNEYSSIKGIMIDENNAANLQNQINEANSQLDKKANKPYNALSLKKILKKDDLYGFKSINVLGTSISHGANAFDIVNQGWAGIMRKFIQEEFKTTNHGYVSMINISNSIGSYVDYHTINPIGTWTKTLTSDTLGFGSYKSSTLGDKLELTIKKPFKYFRVLYKRQTNGGIITAKIGTTVLDINTTGSSFNAGISSKIEVYGEPDYPVILTLEKKDGNPTEILGVMYYDNEEDVFFNNYSRSGLTLNEIDDTILDYICKTNILFFELGHNDRYSNTDINTFKSKIDRIISNVNTNKVKLVVLDTLWYEGTTDKYRVELKRLADSTNAIYIPFHEIMNYSDNMEWKNNGFLSDFSHPSPNGHQQMAEITSKECKLGISSKSIVEKLQSKNEWVYLELKNSWVLPNASLGNKFKTKIIKDGNIVTLNIFCKDGNAGTVAFNIPAEYRPKLTWNNIIEFNGTQYKNVRIDGYSGDVTLEYTTTSKSFSSIITYRLD